MLVITPDQYSQAGFVDQLHASKQDKGQCKLVFADNKAVVLPTRVALLNILYWEPLMQFGIMPSISETFNIKSISGDSSSKIYSVLYDKFLDERPDIDYMLMVHAIFKNISRIYNFITVECCEYMPSIDGLSLALLIHTNPAIKQLTERTYDSKWGTSVAEAQLKQDSKELIKLLKDPNTINNDLYYYMQAGVLKTNQIPQMLLAYGPRSDIDDTMRKHVISASSFGGLKTPEDFATETLSAKKSIYFSRDVIKRSQYFGRKLKLCCSSIEKIYPGSCGAEPLAIPFVIKPEYAHNFRHKVIIVDGKRVHLKDDNAIKPYIGQMVQMVTQFGCNHTDGLCERCAGYGKDRLIKYMPPNIHIGLISSTKTASTVSQKVLSAKHLISTNSKTYNLPESAAKYFFKDNSSIFWHPKWGKKLKGYSIRIPMDALGPIVDLSLEVIPSAESFSKVSYMELLYEDALVDTIQLESEMFIPYLSESTLEYMRANFNKLTIDDDSVTVQLDGFDPKWDIFKYVILNDDMITYTKSVATFLTASVGSYTSLPHALTDFCETVWRKSAVNIFFLETILRTHIINNEQEYQICKITDPHHVMFGKLGDTISNRTVSMKLAFEDLKAYLLSPHTSNIARPVGLFGPFFGII